MEGRKETVTNAGSIVSDTKFEFGSTFLSKYWKSEELLEQETKEEKIKSVIRSSISTLRSVPGTAIASLISITSALLIMTLFLIFDENLKRLLNQVGKSNEAVVYLKEGVSTKQVEVIKNQLLELGATPGRYINKQEALELFKEDLGTRIDLVKGLEENPLPSSIEFAIRSEVESTDTTNSFQLSKEKILAKFQTVEGVDEVVFGAPWTSVAETFRTGVFQMSLTVMVIVTLVVIFLVANVIKLMLFSKKEEIEIMQLVGAPASMVIKPYLLSGLVLGIFGGFAALFVGYFLYITFVAPLNSYLVFGVAYDAIKFLGIWGLLLVIISGGLLGLGGSALALKKWLK